MGPGKRPVGRAQAPPTGGACLVLAERAPWPIDVVDERVMGERERRRWEQPGERGPEGKHRFEDVRRKEVEANVVPYPLIMQTIVEELAREKE